jgi:hypothetical protein
VSNLYEVIESFIGVVEPGQSTPARFEIENGPGRHAECPVPSAY